MMKMINLEKLANVVGGSWTDELLIYYDFICSLYDKYEFNGTWEFLLL